MYLECDLTEATNVRAAILYSILRIYIYMKFENKLPGRNLKLDCPSVFLK